MVTTKVSNVLGSLPNVNTLAVATLNSFSMRILSQTRSENQNSQFYEYVLMLTDGFPFGNRLSLIPLRLEDGSFSNCDRSLPFGCPFDRRELIVRDSDLVLRDFPYITLLFLDDRYRRLYVRSEILPYLTVSPTSRREVFDAGLRSDVVQFQTDYPYSRCSFCYRYNLTFSSAQKHFELHDMIYLELVNMHERPFYPMLALRSTRTPNIILSSSGRHSKCVACGYRPSLFYSKQAHYAFHDLLSKVTGSECPTCRWTYSSLSLMTAHFLSECSYRPEFADFHKFVVTECAIQRAAFFLNREADQMYVPISKAMHDRDVFNIHYQNMHHVKKQFSLIKVMTPRQLRSSLWFEYHRTCEARGIKKNNSCKTLVEVLNAHHSPSLLFADSVFARIVEGQKHRAQTLRQDQKRLKLSLDSDAAFSDIITTLESLGTDDRVSPQVLDFKFIQNFSLNLLPTDLVAEVKALVTKLWANLKDWKDTIVNAFVSLYSKFPLMSALVACCVLLKLASFAGMVFSDDHQLFWTLLGVAVSFLLGYYQKYKEQEFKDYLLNRIASIELMVFDHISANDPHVPLQFSSGPSELLDEDEPIDTPGVSAHASVLNEEAELLVKLCATALGFSPSVHAIKTFISMNRFTISCAQTLRSWSYLSSFVTDWGLKIFEFFVGNDSERAFVHFHGYQDRAFAWSAAVMALDSDDIKIKMNFDDDTRKQVYDLRDYGRKLLVAAEQTKQPVIATTVRKLYDTVQIMANICDKAALNGGTKIDPFCLVFCGDPGVGKSSTLEQASRSIMSDYGERRQDAIYYRNVASDYWDGYTSQPVCAYDDFLVVSGPDVQKVLLEFNMVKSGGGLRLNMADLPDKQRVFSSPLLVIAANTAYPSITGASFTPEAFYRRRDLIWEVQLIPKYQHMSYEQMQSEIPTEERRARLHVRYQRKTQLPKGIGVEGASHTGDYPTPPVTYEEMLEITKQLFAKHIKNQRIVLADSNAHIPLIARCNAAERVLGESSEDDILACTTIEEMNRLNLSREFRDLTYGRCPHAKDTDCNPECRAQDKILSDALAKMKRPLIDQTHRTSVLALSKIFSLGQSQIQKWKQIVQDHPVLSIISAASAVGGVATAWYGLRHLFKAFNRDEIEPELLASGDDKTGRVKQMKLVHARTNVIRGLTRAEACDEIQTGNERLNEAKLNVMAQSCEDPNALAIATHVLPQNLFNVSFKKRIGTDSTMKATAIGGTLLMMPLHFFAGANNGDKLLIDNGKDYYEEVIDLNRFIQYSEQTIDLCVYECSPRFPMQKNIVHCFISENEVAKVNVCQGLLLHSIPTAKGEKAYQMIYGELRALTERTKDLNYSYANGVDKLYFHLQRGWSLIAPTQKGDCGALLIAMNKRVSGKMIGMHVAGTNNQSHGYSILVTREMLESLVALSTSGLCDIEDVPDEFIEPQGLEFFNVDPIGTLSSNCCFKPQWSPRQNTKTTIMKSAIHDRVFPHVSEPAILSIKDPRNVNHISPILNGISKYSEPTLPFDRKYLKYAIGQVGLQNSFDWPRADTDDMTVDYVIRGDGDGVNKMNLQSSAGFPWVLRPGGQHGKIGLINQCEKTGECSMKPSLAESVVGRLLKMRDNIRPFSAWIDCAKDERRPVAKIQSVKTRLFTIAPVDFTIVCRILCLDFVNAFQKNHASFYSAVGIDPESFDWEVMHKRLEEVGNTGFDGDFSSFDGKLQPECISAAFDLISDWYDVYRNRLCVKIDSHTIILTASECRGMRRLLSDEIVHTNQLVFNTLYTTHQGNPSGNPLTVILNSMVNAMYLRTAYASLVGIGNKLSYDNEVRDKIYGDDNIVSVSSAVRDKFNFTSVSEFLGKHLIGYTPADKDESGVIHPFKPLNQLRFLKRTTRHNGFCRVPIITLDTPREMVNWVRATNASEAIEQLYVNIENALRFIYFYGRADFESFKKQVNDEMRSQGLKNTLLSYDVLDAEFLNNIF
jgi:hypothetical protein